MDSCDFKFEKMVTGDAGELATGLSAWHQTYEQISAGTFSGQLEDLSLGAVQIFRERSTRTVLQNGAGRAGTITVAVTRSHTARGWFSGHQLEGERLIAYTAHDEFNLLAGEEMELVAVCIDTGKLTRLASQVRGSAFRVTLPPPSVLNAGLGGTGELKELLNSAISLANDYPSLLRCLGVQRMLVSSITEAVLECLAPSHSAAERMPSAAARQRIVITARDYMRTHADEALSVHELCAVTKTSRRTLQYAFEDVLQISPLTYLRVMRLNSVRRELRLHDADTVGDVAARWGFWHLSRFAAEYRTMFGELPSVTRARASGSTPERSRAKQPRAGLLPGSRVAEFG